MSVEIEAGEVLGQCPKCGANVYHCEGSMDVEDVTVGATGYRQFRGVPDSKRVVLLPCADVLIFGAIDDWVQAMKATRGAV